MSSVPLWICLPFAALLICIAVMPLVAGEWWEKHQLHVVILLSVLFIIPFAVLFGAGTSAETVLECVFNDYLTFIVLLFGLYCVDGYIHLEGDLEGSPRVNVIMLLLGSMLASFIGTTGASMLLVRPVIKMNSWRRNRAHIMVFFIFLVSNIGGCLTPIGDPPLLMGFSRGVPFAWSFHLLPVLAVNTVLLLFIFYVIDRRAYRRDIVAGMRPDISGTGTKISLKGVHNLVFIGMIIFAVILSGVLPKLPAFQDAAGETVGIHIFGEVSFPISSLIEVIIILLAAFLSFRTTKKSVRVANHFTWGAIR
ncbi:MAG: sodium:proton antiporter, partial [Clostridiales bacterium]|nr:sodium:proton antiporter [Clostridiales bacterium]